ncbi:MAG TPA: hypothetical protein IAD46_05170 [Candidatus Pelethenecus faecipullorum]|uniref:ATP synthase F1 complex delta/epsilon subunit N-terminal domain-containing protein n=1 Tax=Candidatus Pelethenecus faecipullorum TaxID=2840900 RepID=A0A9D1GSH7_9MOLU|nr:hypothetical protein [Candidatus Pelethenecus faecipullorum]
MKIIVSTHQGILYDEEVDYVVVSNEDGEFAVLDHHIPVLVVIKEGYIKLVRSDQTFFVVIVHGIAEFHDGVFSVLTQEARLGQTKESAMDELVSIRKHRLEENRKESVDFTQKEKELREHIKNSKAGQL